MATPDNHEPSFPDAVYQQVKDWIAQQEAFEKENKAPAPLTDVQRAFLDSFRARPPLLDVGQDFVSLLCKYRQDVPKGKNIAFIDDIHPVRDALGNPQWICTVELSETLVHEPNILSFPAAGFGLNGDGSYRPFAKKKDAKRYAAQCAIDWLDKNSLLPSNLRDIAFPQGSTPTAGNLPILQSQPEPTKRPSEGTNGVLSPPPKRQTKGTNGAVDVDDEDLPATQRVQALCHSMGLKAPTYVLNPADPRVNYLFNGYPDFGDDDDAFPEDLGRITGVSGKNNAKQEIAEQVLAHLREVYRERAAQHSESTGL